MLSQDHLRALFDYDEASGMLRWKVGRRRGKPAGCLDTDGYHRVKINRRMYPAHRVVFTLLKGCWPVGQIDHINGNKADNRISNLRDVTASENQQNRHGPNRGNRFLWVSHKSREDRWRAGFRFGGKDVLVGYFDTAEDAHTAAIAKRIEMGLLVSPALSEPKAEQGA